MTRTNSKTTAARAARWLVSALLVAGSLPGLALEPSTPLANYGRQSWVMENGLPQNTVQAMVQSKDGFIWLGTEVGLVRFDGNSFAIFDQNSSPALPGNDIRCLLETRDGSLWIGTSDGLARWKNGVVTPFGTANGLPGTGIRALVAAASGCGPIRAWPGSTTRAGLRMQPPKPDCPPLPSPPSPPTARARCGC